MFISVLINNYNNGQYIDYCINSTLNQTYEHYEVIIYDDGSTDNSMEIIKKYQDHPRIKIISEHHHGKGAFLNQVNAVYKAFLVSKGEIICLLDGDDAFLPTKLSRIVEIFEDSTIDMVQHLLYEIDEKNYSTKRLRPLLKVFEQQDMKEYVYNTANLLQIVSLTSGQAFHRDIFNKIMPLDQEQYDSISIDIRAYIYVMLFGKIRTIYEPLGEYRKHSTNHSSRFSIPLEYKKYLEELYLYFNQAVVKYKYRPIVFCEQNVQSESIFVNELLDKDKFDSFIRANLDKTFYIWGAGEAGVAIHYLLSKHNIRVSGFIDRNKQENRKLPNECPVIEEVNLFPKKQAIFIAAYYAEEEISNYLTSIGYTANIDFIYPFRDYTEVIK